MATMKIGEKGESYSGATFSFPDNPKTADIQMKPNRKFKNVPFGKMHIVNDFGGQNPKMIVLNGVFHGTNKRSNYNDLAYHIDDSNLKKFFISDNRFYYFLGNNVKETLSGERTNFIDYVANLWTPIPYLFGDTENTYTYSTISSSEITLNDTKGTGSFDNSGNAPSFVRWEINNASGANITKVEIGDGSSLSGSNRKLTWTGTLSSGSTLTIYIIKFISQSSGHKYMKYAYPEIGGSKSGGILLEGGVTGIPYINPNTTDQSFSIKLTGNDNTTDITAKFRDTYLS